MFWGWYFTVTGPPPRKRPVSQHPARLREKGGKERSEGAPRGHGADSVLIVLTSRRRVAGSISSYLVQAQGSSAGCWAGTSASARSVWATGLNTQIALRLSFPARLISRIRSLPGTKSLTSKQTLSPAKPSAGTSSSLTHVWSGSTHL
jgi:hypothetical protein